MNFTVIIAITHRFNMRFNMRFNQRTEQIFSPMRFRYCLLQQTLALQLFAMQNTLSELQRDKFTNYDTI